MNIVFDAGSAFLLFGGIVAGWFGGYIFGWNSGIRAVRMEGARLRRTLERATRES